MSLAARLFPDEFYRGADLRVVQAIPADALDILVAGNGNEPLNEILLHLNPARRITATGAFSLPPGAPSRFDAIVVGENLLREPDPVATLSALRPLLPPNGRLLAALSNAQHWTQLERLLRGEPPSGATAPQLIRLLLDAGYLPRLADRRTLAAPDAWIAALPGLAENQNLGLPTCLARSQALTYIIDARPLAAYPAGPVPPVTVGACTNSADVLADNLLASPELREGGHEILTVEGATNAADGLNAVIEQAQHELVVLAHQDVYLPHGWFARLWQQYEAARRLTGDRVGVMGVYGVRGTSTGIERAGRVADRDGLLDESTPLPSPSTSLDELVLIVPKRSPLRFSPALGYHLYGTDIALAAAQAGLAAVVIDAPSHHNSQQGDELPAAFQASADVLRAKWPMQLPIVTPCMLIGASPA